MRRAITEMTERTGKENRLPSQVSPHETPADFPFALPSPFCPSLFLCAGWRLWDADTCLSALGRRSRCGTAGRPGGRGRGASGTCSGTKGPRRDPNPRRPSRVRQALGQAARPLGPAVRPCFASSPPHLPPAALRSPPQGLGSAFVLISARAPTARPSEFKMARTREAVPGLCLACAWLVPSLCLAAHLFFL